MAECGRSYRGGVLSLLVVQATVLLCYPAGEQGIVEEDHRRLS